MYISVSTVYTIIIRNHKGMSHLEIMSVYCLRVTANREGKKYVVSVKHDGT